MSRIGFLGSALTTGIVTGQAVNDANRVKRQNPDQLLDNEILVAETKLKKAKARRGGCCGTSERTIEKLEARLAKLRLIKEDRNTFEVVVPPGGHPGATLEGDTFSLPYVKQAPVAQGVVVARAGASPAAGGEGGG